MEANSVSVRVRDNATGKEYAYSLIARHPIKISRPTCNDLANRIGKNILLGVQRGKMGYTPGIPVGFGPVPMSITEIHVPCDEQMYRIFTTTQHRHFKAPQELVDVFANALGLKSDQITRVEAKGPLASSNL